MRRVLLLSLAVLLAGCQNGGASSAKGAPPEPPPTTAGLDGATPKGDFVPVPENLKHAGYRYYSLASDKPVDLEIRISDRPDVYTGSQTPKLQGVKDGKATYLIERTGALVDFLGLEETISLEEDGIYLVSSKMLTMKGRDLQLPADLAPGKEWTEVTEATDAAGQAMHLENRLKAVREEPVKTKAGDFSALLVTSSGNGKVQGKAVKITSRTWYAKDVGMVKMEMVSTGPDGKPKQITVERTGPAK